MREKILLGEYIDVFSLLFQEIEKKDKEDLGKERKVRERKAHWEIQLYSESYGG